MHSVNVKHILKQLSADTELLTPNVSRPFVLEVKCICKGFGGVLL